MKNSFLKICLFIVLGFSLFTCSKDDDLSQKIQLRLVSEVTGDPVAGAEVLVLAEGTRGEGIFAFNYEISRRIGITDSDGYLSVVLNYESSDDFFTIYTDSEVCTDILRPTNSFFFEEIQGATPLELKVRRYFPMEVIVKSINPYDETDRFSVGFYHTGSNNYNAPLYKIENRGKSNEVDDNPGVGNGLQPFWIADYVDSTIFKRVQEGTEAKISWTVVRNNVVSSFESEFIPTVQNGITYYEINY